MAAFGTSWAWINYSWFASAYDTDDWVFRKIGETAIVLSVVIPVAIFVLALYALYSVIFRTADGIHLWLVTGTALLLLASVLLAAAGAGVPAGLLVVALAPVVTIVGYETVGHRHMAEALRRL